MIVHIHSRYAWFCHLEQFRNYELLWTRIMQTEQLRYNISSRMYLSPKSILILNVALLREALVILHDCSFSHLAKNRRGWKVAVLCSLRLKSAKKMITISPCCFVDCNQLATHPSCYCPAISGVVQSWGLQLPLFLLHVDEVRALITIFIHAFRVCVNICLRTTNM